MLSLQFGVSVQLWKKPLYSLRVETRLCVTFNRVEDLVAGSLNDVADRFCSGSELQRGTHAVWTNGSALMVFKQNCNLSVCLSVHPAPLSVTPHCLVATLSGRSRGRSVTVGIQFRRMNCDGLWDVVLLGGRPLRMVLVNCQPTPGENSDISDL